MQLEGYVNYGHVCVSFSGSGRLHLGNKYVYISMHHYCGPTFYIDKDMNKEYVFIDDIENDPIWELFNVWYDDYKKLAKKAGKYWA